VAFSTAPNTVALDGDGKHSPFAQALIKHLPTPELDIALMMRRVRRDVRRATKRQQTPWDSSSLTQPFYFFPKTKQDTKTIPKLPKAQPSQFELSYWDSVKSSSNTRLIKSYLRKYPKGHFADLADTVIQELDREQASRTTQAAEERKARQAELDRAQAKQAQEAALKKASEARRQNEYKKALADAKAAKRAQQTAEANLRQALAEAQKAREEKVRARERRKAQIEKSEKEKTLQEAEKTRLALLIDKQRRAEEARQTEARKQQEGRRKKTKQLAMGVQERLKELGCYKGLIDGDFGFASRAAWQRATKTSFGQREVNDLDLQKLASLTSDICRQKSRPKSKPKTKLENEKPKASTKRKTSLKKRQGMSIEKAARQCRNCSYYERTGESLKMKWCVQSYCPELLR